MRKFNIKDFGANDSLPNGEIFDTLVLAKNSSLKIERILSRGDVSADGFWYEQSEDEFVMLVSGSARIQFEDKEIELSSGDCVIIPKMSHHRVSYTSLNPPCVWLTVFGNFD